MGENGSQGGSWFVPSSTHPLFLSQLSTSADLAVAAFLTFTGVVSVLGNGMVLLVYCKKRKKLRPPELMTVNLALCDFGFSLVGTPFFIISSLCHAWVFGELGCLWYGIQGFVFGIGSLLTTCLISVDRCLKICYVRYGQWIERRHVSLFIVLLWVNTFFWALLPAFGFGSYAPEPYGTSCTVNWWAIRSSLNDTIYIFLILILCFGFPTLTIITSYLAILLTVYRSNRTLASIPSSSVSHSSKDLRLAKIAAVVCATFLVAWLPYATVSLISAVTTRDDQEVEGTLQTVMEDTAASNSPRIVNITSFLNMTAAQYYRQIYHNLESSEVNNVSSASTASLSDTVFRSTMDKTQKTIRTVPLSSLPPVFTLIPAMFAKSHCMINPLIYQIMNREFRDSVYAMVFGQEAADRRRAQRRKDSSYETRISLSYCQSSSRKRSNPTPSSAGSSRNLKIRGTKGGGRSDSWVDNISVETDTLDFASLDTQDNMERHCSTRGQRDQQS